MLSHKRGGYESRMIARSVSEHVVEKRSYVLADVMATCFAQTWRCGPNERTFDVLALDDPQAVAFGMLRLRERGIDPGGWSLVIHLPIDEPCVPRKMAALDLESPSERETRRKVYAELNTIADTVNEFKR